MAKPTSKQSEPESLSRSQILIAMGLTALLLLLVAKVWLRLETLPKFPLFWSSQDLLRGLALSGGISGGSALLYKIWPRYRTSADGYLNFILKPLHWPDLVWIGLLPGLSEELLFRGVMLPALGLDGFGLVTSSLCFGVLHMSSLKSWPYAVWAAAIGLALGASALITGNLLVPVTAHVFANVAAGLTWKWQSRRQSQVSS